MQEIKLSKGLVAIVDDDDFERVSKYAWHASESTKNGHIYAKAFIGKIHCYLHRFILGVTDRSIIVDHRDRDTLNNQKDNLRTCTRAQNRSNSNMNRNKKMHYRGVARDGRKFVSFITVDKKRKYLGRFENQIVAALAYNEAAVKYYGEFAVLNTIKRVK